MEKNNDKLIRFLLTFFLGWIGSIIINHTDFKPEGYTSRTLAYFFLTYLTLGIYPPRCVDLQPDLRSRQGKKHRLQEGLIFIPPIHTEAEKTPMRVSFLLRL